MKDKIRGVQIRPRRFALVFATGRAERGRDEESCIPKGLTIVRVNSPGADVHSEAAKVFLNRLSHSKDTEGPIRNGVGRVAKAKVAAHDGDGAIELKSEIF